MLQVPVTRGLSGKWVFAFVQEVGSWGLGGSRGGGTGIPQLLKQRPPARPDSPASPPPKHIPPASFSPSNSLQKGLQPPLAKPLLPFLFASKAGTLKDTSQVKAS